MEWFQSLNRAYKRSDIPFPAPVRSSAVVSIPQSGLQAFRRHLITQTPSVPEQFQSLNRAYKRSDVRDCWFHNGDLSSFNPSIGLTSVPTSNPIFIGPSPFRFNP